MPAVSIESDLLIKSIGYASVPMAGVPFDERSKTIPNEFGSVLGEDGKPSAGLYVCGWAKRGPVGIIDATLRDTKETFGVLRHHIESGQLAEKTTSVEQVESMLDQRHVSYDSWITVDDFEKAEGRRAAPPKVREKVLSRDEMLAIARQKSE